MQTFILNYPYIIDSAETMKADIPNFLAACAYTASILDDRRLNKQITEAGQIIGAILDGPTDRSRTLFNHPATQAWTGCQSPIPDQSESAYESLCRTKYVPALRVYRYFLWWAWVNMRKGTYQSDKTEPVIEGLPNEDFIVPWWFNESNINRSHALSLFNKDSDFYTSTLGGKYLNDYHVSSQGDDWGNRIEFTYFWPVEKWNAETGKVEHYYQIKLGRDWFHCKASAFDWHRPVLFADKA